MDRKNKIFLSCWKQADLILFLIALALGTVIRLKYLAAERMWPDEALYAWGAKQIFRHPSLIFSKEIIAFHPPLFPLLLSLGHFFFPPELACRVISMAINMTGIIGIYWLGTRIQSRFLGIFCAIGLCFHFTYLMSASRILSDGVLTVSLIYFALLLLNITKATTLKHDLYAGLAAGAVILLKWPGLVAIPLLAGYYLMALSALSITQRLQKVFAALIIPVMITAFLLINNKVQLGSFLPDISALQGLYLIEPFWYYVFQFHNIIMIPFLIPFFLYGLIHCFRKKDRARILLLLWFMILFTAISLTPEKNLGYALWIVPGVLLISGLGMTDIFSRCLKRPDRILKAEWIALLILFLFFGFMHPRTQKYLDIDSKQFSGFPDAGVFIKEQALRSPDILIVAGSPRLIRYYTDINFQEFAGTLTGIPGSQEAFARMVRQNNTGIILVVDYWERAQPSFIFPLTPLHLKFIDDMGFHLTKTMTRKVLQNNGEEQDIAVIWIFSRQSTRP